MGVTTALDIASPDDLNTLHMVRDALQNATTQNPLLHRSHFMVIVKTAKDWSLDSLCDHVKRVVQHLQIDKLDVLLLSRDSMPPRQNVYERKRVVSAYWECMVQVQRLGLAREIGVSDLLMDEMELIGIAFPANPPAVLGISIEIATDKSHEARTTLRDMLSFAHGRSMDVLVRFPIRGLDRPTEAWEEVRFRIAQRLRATVFDASIVNEAEAEPYYTERHDMTESETLQTSLQIIVRYFIQQGVVVIPVLDGEDDNHFTEDEAHQLFTVLPHPFTGLEPSYSPQTQYSSILTRDELVEIDRVLPLVVTESQADCTE
ncbi:hypothetical protein Poli38472_005506 [Pythium oligandrum]|uniref:Uncharacterized protein n=1 Tax=Pythium oligandrum TaxID=41045 RepID=A0A8K1CI39_PYTOL|nr:hypothetical protein Poli38472_005506 [Pythium oligandrum]|eukprot:TMW62888.1 hypothetical protein Poli38472_005506 [Pythium oligandrum]